MKDLQLHEKAEMIVLDRLRRAKLLDPLVFGGGTMLRLCFDLPRYSVDLDFYPYQETDFKLWAKKMTAELRQVATEILDAQQKHFTYLWEFRISPSPRKLKLEVRRKKLEGENTQLNIAHSIYSPLQVRLRTLTLNQMWINKVRALTDRNEIRDAYDLEFLSRRNAGDFGSLDQDVLTQLLATIKRFKPQDFKVTLGSVLNQEERAMVLSSKFSYLKSKIEPLLSK